MFTNISWTNYIVVVILLLVIYYIIIGMRFYYHDLKNLLSGNQKFKSRPSTALSGVQNDYNPLDEHVQSEMFQPENDFAETTDETFLEVEHLIVRLKEAIVNASGKKYIKQEFFLYLQLILKEYPILKNSQFQSVINELIISECAKYGSIMLSEEEVVALWNE